MTKITRLAQNVAKGAQAEQEIGKALGLLKNTQKFPTSYGTRIPDFLTSTAIHEVKAVKKLNLIQQLQGFLEIAELTGRTLIIHIRQGTELTRPLQKLADEGKIIIKRDTPF